MHTLLWGLFCYMENINELFMKEGCSIHAFKKGDLIIRLTSLIKEISSFNDNLGISIIVSKELDNSFRRIPVEFVAIENNIIYLKDIKPFCGKVWIHKVLLEEYSEGWNLFVIPEGLTLEDCI